MPEKPTYEELEDQIQALKKSETKRKQAEENLKKSLEKYRDLVEGVLFAMSLDMICIADINTATFIKVNPSFTEALGHSEEALLEKSFLDFIHPDDVHATRAVIDQNLKSGAKVINFENRYRCKDGSYRWLSWVSHPNPDQGITYAVARDITQTKLTDEKLQESETRCSSFSFPS